MTFGWFSDGNIGLSLGKNIINFKIRDDRIIS